jgi:hypothetical protein
MTTSILLICLAGPADGNYRPTCLPVPENCSSWPNLLLLEVRRPSVQSEVLSTVVEMIEGHLLND